MQDLSFDIIIIGAGAAGCVLANKLGADKSKSILVLEAGPPDRDLMIHIPAGVYRVWRDPRLNWNYQSAPQDNLGNRPIPIPRGKVVGGSSSINSMVYMRGHPRDYDGWAANHGLPDWSFAHCLPYFKAGESSDRGPSDHRGANGPLSVSRGTYDNPIYDAFIAAGEEAGQGRTDDPNGPNPEGVTRYDATRRNGRRCSSAVANLRPALKRGNITLLTHAQATRITTTGTRATGVDFTRAGASYHANAAQIVLAGGAINAPHLLMLSGIGPAEHLAAHDIPLVANLPGVGQNLMDHPTVIMQFESLKSFPLHKIDHPLRKALAGAWWVFARKGPATSNIWEAGGVVRSNATTPLPNIQYHLGPVGFHYEGDRLRLSQGFVVHIDLLRPTSRGQVRLTSADPLAKPRLAFNFLSHPDEIRQLVEGVRKTRELVAQKAFSGLAGAEQIPGPATSTDAEIADWVRSAMETDFHPCGTCRMGTGPEAVVDSSGRVIGMDGLYVADASVIPAIPGGNLNAPTQMIAARIADAMTGTPPLPPFHAAFAF